MIKCEFETDAVLQVNWNDLSGQQFGNTCQSNQNSISRDVSKGHDQDIAPMTLAATC